MNKKDSQNIDQCEIILPRPRKFLPKQKEVFDLIFKENLGDNDKPINNYGLYSGAFRCR